MVVSFMEARDQPGVFFFRTERATSEAGRALAEEIATRLGMNAAGMATPILKETRPVAVVVAAPVLDEKVGRETGQGLQVLFSAALD